MTESTDKTDDWYEAHRKQQCEYHRNWVERRRKEDPEWDEKTRARDRKRKRDRRKYNREWKARNSERVTRSNRASLSNAPIRYLLRGVKYSAKKNGAPFDLDPSDFEMPTTCPVLGIRIVFPAPPHTAGLPSFDRIIPELGYVKGNVRIISYRANILKRDCTDPAELRAVADYIESNR